MGEGATFWIEKRAVTTWGDFLYFQRALPFWGKFVCGSPSSHMICCSEDQVAYCEHPWLNQFLIVSLYSFLICLKCFPGVFSDFIQRVQSHVSAFRVLYLSCCFDSDWFLESFSWQYAICTINQRRGRSLSCTVFWSPLYPQRHRSCLVPRSWVIMYHSAQSVDERLVRSFSLALSLWVVRRGLNVTNLVIK